MKKPGTARIFFDREGPWSHDGEAGRDTLRDGGCEAKLWLYVFCWGG
jgi:hypothetical protein